ncbi:MAG: cell division ATP-binding protein FtsE [Legionellales bacterium]|nr:cell division ATP-binding protein FtsE [Legionellales bacterium]
MDVIIHLQNVSKRYPNGHVGLSGINLAVQAGEMVFLTGHSGAGKTTLLKLMNGIERPSSGQVIINHQNITRLAAKKIPYLRRQIGIVFQNPHLLPDQTVFDNVALPLIIAGQLRQTEMKRRVRAALDKVGLLHKEKYYSDALSGGEQQRVGIARAVVNKPIILLADEPTGNLDPELSLEIMTLFSEFQQVGTTVLIATHDIALISQFDKRIIKLSSGRIITNAEQEVMHAL